ARATAIAQWVDMPTPALLPALLTAWIQASPAPPPSPRANADRGVPRIAVEANVVELDVVVTDEHGQPVGDLGVEDFEILEDGRSRPIPHSVPAVVAPPPSRAGAPSPAPSASSEAEPGPRRVVLVVDDYHLEPEDLSAVRKALLRYIDSQLAAG